MDDNSRALKELGLGYDDLSVPPRVSSIQASQNLQGSKSIEEEILALKNSQSSLNKAMDLKYWHFEEQVLEFELEAREEKYEEEKIKYLAAGGDIRDKEWQAKEVEFEVYYKNYRANIDRAFDQKVSLSKIMRGPQTIPAEGPDKDEAFAKLWLLAYEEKAGRDDSAQSNLRKTLIKTYNLRSPEDPKSYWCQVLGIYIKNDMLVDTAQIFPAHLGQEKMTLLFGEESENELYSQRNSLFLSKVIEQRFDTHQLVIIPHASQPKQASAKGIDKWVVRVLDTELLDQEVFGFGVGCKRTFGDIDGKLLEFLSDARPAASYLYYHYVVSILLSKRYNRKTTVKDTAREMAWPVVGRYLRKEALLFLSEVLGQVEPGELEQFDDHFTD